jgi:signal peptidase II
MVNKNFVSLFSIITVIVVLLDQLSKYLVELVQPAVNLGIFSIHLIYNTGAGFGILKGQTLWLGIISLIVAVVIITFYKRIPAQNIPQVLFALLLGGVIGNGIDRIFRRMVVDFIDFLFWPAFNIADMAITVSAIGIVLLYWKEK